MWGALSDEKQPLGADLVENAVYYSIVIMTYCLVTGFVLSLAKLLPNNGRCIVACVMVVAYHRVYMLQYITGSG
jgi:hypothetical protein